MNIITSPGKTINLAESFLDLNKKIKERFSEILIERSENFLANKILNANTKQFLDSNKTNNLNLKDLNQANLDSNKKSEIPNFNNGDATLLKKKTIRDSQERKKIEDNDITKKSEEILLFDKFARTENSKIKNMGNNNNDNSKIFSKASISEYKSKLSRNFYLFLNKNSEKSYLTNKKVYVDEVNDIKKEQVLISQYQNQKNDFKIKFNSDADNDQMNLDLNETDFNAKFTSHGDNIKLINKDEIDDNDEIIIPDII